MPTYQFQMAQHLAGFPVSVSNASTGAVVATGTLDASAKFSAQLGVGDYVASAASGKYSYKSAGTVDPAAARRYTNASASLITARVVVIGDSIENLYSYRTASNESFGKDWPTYAMLLSGGRFQLVRNMGTGGETTSQYLARFDADVAPSSPTMVVIGAAENDIQQSVPIATSKSNIVAMVDKARALGAVPVVRTTMPHNLSNAVRQKIGAFNHWLRNFGAEQGIPVLDFWAQLVDTATGQYKAAYTPDGVHPNEAGSKILGQYAADTLAPLLAPAPLTLAMDPTDAGQLLPTPLFLTNTSGTPTGWNAIGGSPTGVVRSMVTDALVPGQMARIAHTASTTTVSLQNNSSSVNTSKASPGDILEISGVLSSDGGVQASVIVTVTYNDGSAKTISRQPVAQITAALTRATYRVRMPALPVGFQYLQVSLQAASGTGVVDFGYPVCRNLTAEGLL